MNSVEQNRAIKSLTSNPNAGSRNRISSDAGLLVVTKSRNRISSDAGLLVVTKPHISTATPMLDHAIESVTHGDSSRFGKIRTKSTPKTIRETRVLLIRKLCPLQIIVRLSAWSVRSIIQDHPADPPSVPQNRAAHIVHFLPDC